MMEETDQIKPLHPLPVRFNEIKFMCLRYPYVILKNKNGFTTMMKSKDILNSSVFIHTDLTTTWVSVTGVSWIDYILIRFRLRHADQL